MSNITGLIFGLSLKDQAVFFRQVASMIDAGLTVVRALSSLAPQLSGRMRAVVTGMIPNIDAGMPFSEALARHPEYFSEFLVSMVRAGEVGGMLDLRLKEAAEFLEESYNIQQSLVSQMIYPAVILHAAVFLPPLFILVTQGFGPYLAHVLPLLVALYAAAIGLFLVSRLGSVFPGPRTIMDACVLRVPLIGKVVRGAAAMRFLRALGDLIESGFPNAQALTVAAHACGNMALSQRLVAVVPVASEGGPLTAALAPTRVFTQATLQMLATGEESGNMGHMMRKASEYLQIEHREAVKRAMAVMPVLLMLMMGVIVGYQYISAFSGIFSQINSINP